MRPWLAVPGLIGITAIWGVTFPLTHEALADTPPLLFLFLRFVVSAAALFALGIPLRRARLSGPRPALVCGALLFGGFALQTLGLAHTTSARAAFITGLCVVLVPAFEYMFFRARFGSRVLGGILLSFVGLALLAMGEPPVAAAGRDVLKGDLLVLGCAVCFAFHILALARYGQSEDAIALAAWQTLVVVVVALPAHMAFESWSWPSHQVWGVIAFLALVATAAVTVMQISFQRHVTATQAALIFALEPVFASIFAWLMQGEILPLAGLSGSVAMLAGALAASWPSRQN